MLFSNFLIIDFNTFVFELHMGNQNVNASQI